MSAAEKIQLDEFVEAKLGADALKALCNQSRGGDNNQKGNRHEQFFAVYKLAKYFGESPTDCIEISSQDRAFVDDLVVLNKSKDIKRSYQLKDSKSVYWHNKKGIKPYFKRQHIIDKEFHKNSESETVLVLANENTFKLRSSDIPRDIKKHTRCLHFPNFDTINELIVSNKEFRDAIGQLCAWPDDTSKIEVVAQLLLGAWASKNYTVRSAKDLVDSAKMGADPNFFCVRGSELKIDEDLKNILDNLRKLNYDVRSGLLTYSVAGGLSGYIEHKVGTPEFKALSEKIVDEHPTEELSLLRILFEHGDGA